jgi:hypothetical protein
VFGTFFIGGRRVSLYVRQVRMPFPGQRIFDKYQKIKK